MQIDHTQVFVSPSVIPIAEWIYTDLPKSVQDVHNVVLLGGASTPSHYLGASADDEEN